MSCASCGKRCCMRELPTGTITLLFTDIEGSTRLLQQVGHRYDGILTEYRQLLRAAFHRWSGYEVDTQGDAFFVASPWVSTSYPLQRVRGGHPGRCLLRGLCPRHRCGVPPSGHPTCACSPSLAP